MRDRIRSQLVLPEGMEAGFAGALVVVGVFLVRDVSIGEPLHTPSVLGALLTGGLEAARDTRSDPGAAALYNAVHFFLWIALGFVGSFLMERAERDPRMRWLPYGAAGAAILAMLALDLVVRDTPLTRPHLWIGGISGLAAMGAYLLWRHPDALRGGS
jgi:hypothetical protein